MAATCSLDSLCLSAHHHGCEMAAACCVRLFPRFYYLPCCPQWLYESCCHHTAGSYSRNRLLRSVDNLIHMIYYLYLFTISVYPIGQQRFMYSFQHYSVWFCYDMIVWHLALLRFTVIFLLTWWNTFLWWNTLPASAFRFCLSFLFQQPVNSQNTETNIVEYL